MDSSLWKDRCIFALLAVSLAALPCNSFTTTPSVITKPIRLMSPTQIQSLAHYGAEASALFNNMKTPASILAGALVPLGMLAPISIESPPGSNETRFEKTLRVLYSAVAVLSLCSELLVVIWATVASNQLIETSVAPSESVWALLHRDYKLEWAATNAHFVAGMYGFVFMVATKTYFAASGGKLGRSFAGFALSGLLMMIAVFNRGVASGSGDGLRYGATVLALWTQYIPLLVKRALNPSTFGLLETSSGILLLLSLNSLIRVCWSKMREKKK